MIVLVGFMGSGKTTMGAKLARHLGSKFQDSDLEIQKIHGAISEIFANFGELQFRKLEADTIAQLLADGTRQKYDVLALGGGSCEAKSTRELLAKEVVVFLDIPFQMALARVKRDPNRPVLQDPKLKQRFFVRRKTFQKIADITVDVRKTFNRAAMLELVSKIEETLTERGIS